MKSFLSLIATDLPTSACAGDGVLNFTSTECAGDTFIGSICAEKFSAGAFMSMSQDY